MDQHMAEGMTNGPLAVPVADPLGADHTADQTLTLTQPSPPPNKCCAQAVLVCRKNSHPFVERRVTLESAAKVGRAVARCKPANDNFVFDCKVLSRNHAILWFENQKFYLKDTASSNGTFVNNQRLSPANEESSPREVFSGDVVQFGVDVTENTRKVTHGCIIASLRLYLPDGSEAKAQEAQEPQSPNQSNICITSLQLYELSQLLSEALHREQILENKLETLERVVTNAHESANTGWKSLVEEDRLLSRIETLQSKLELYVNSQQSSQNKDSIDGRDSDDTSALHNVRAEALKLIEDKEKYESAAKEAIQKALEEKLIVLTKVHELEVAVKSNEEECTRLQLVCETSAQEINRLANSNDELNKEIESYVKRLKNFEDQKIALIEATTKEREELEEKIASLKTKESENNKLISELKKLNDSANLQIEKLKLQLEVMKQWERVDNDSNNDNNSVSIEPKDSADALIANDLSVSADDVKRVKHLIVTNDKCVETGPELNGLPLQSLTESSVTLTNSMAGSMVESANNLTLINGQLSSAKDHTSGRPNESKIDHDSDQTNDHGDHHADSYPRDACANSDQASAKRTEPVPSDQTTSQLSSDMEQLKELLAETRASKKSIDEELSRTVTELENLRALTKQMSLEAEELQQKLEKSWKEVEEKNVLITSLKNQINELTERVRNVSKDNESIKCKVGENEKLLHLKDDELSSLRVLLDEERNVQQKYANKYEQCKKELCDSRLEAKQFQTEAELLRKKVYSCNEELRSSRSNLSSQANDDALLSAKQKEVDKWQSECHQLKSKLQSRESELISHRTQHQKLSADYECLQNAMQLMQQINSELEQRGDNYWRDRFNEVQSQALNHQTQLSTVSNELEELKTKLDDCLRDKEAANERLMSFEEDIEIFSYQSRTATACAVIPLLILLIAVLMAYYPSVSTVTGTKEM